ncbi:MAG: ribonuclease III [Legionellales bacterium]|nr:ribonuclease III [Legionellales bacterium]
MQLTLLQRKLTYSFEDPRLLTMALTHRSVQGKNNERLEFLGDALLSLIMADSLYRQFPEASEGQLSQLRSSLVKGHTLANIGRSLQLSEHLVMGPGEYKTGGHQRSSTLADAVEAILAAIYLDSGLAACQQVVQHLFATYFQALSLDPVGLKDAKSQLQEWLQAKQWSLPVYTVLEVTGQAHERVFTVTCQVVQWEHTVQGVGASRRKAEQAAASQLLTELKCHYE